jgi:hypothetical protein
MATQLSRYSTTKGGFRTDILPWRLYQKGKKLASCRVLPHMDGRSRPQFG